MESHLAVASTLASLVAGLEADVRQRTPGSVALSQRGAAVMPGGASGDGKTWWPLFFAGAHGSKVSDIDGNEYIDLVLGIGPNLLGHTDEAIVAGVHETFSTLGGAVAAGTVLEVELAERIARTIPVMEQMRFVSTGSEATMMAIRAARAYTGKPRIAKFEGHYHGQHDEMLISAFGGVAGELRAPVAVPDCVGLNDSAERNAIVLPWNDIEAVEQILSARVDEVAALICEPVPCVPQGGEPPEEGFLQAIRELTERLGILLIFDEVVTGLRMREGSAAAHFGVAPDLITLGKVAGGGLPIGVFGGRAEIMCTVVGPEADPAHKMFQSGTFSGSPVVMAAGIALIDRLADGTAHARADATAERLREGLKEAAAAADLAVQITGISSWFWGVLHRPQDPQPARHPVQRSAAGAGVLDRSARTRGVLQARTPRLHVGQPHRRRDRPRAGAQRRPVRPDRRALPGARVSATQQAVYDPYVNGAAREPASGQYLESINPAVGEPWAAVADCRGADVDAAVMAADAAFRSDPWRGFSATKRGRLLFALADLIAAEADGIARVETRDNGKLLREMTGQLTSIPDWLRYYAGLADKVEGRVIPMTDPRVLNYTVREPLGVVAVIVPWNSPVFTALMAVGPAIAAGNTVVIKPSELTSASILEVMPLVAAAGFPPGVINVVTGGAETGRLLVDHPRVAQVTFTGGTATGAEVAASAGKRFSRCVLELGGKSPNIVCADANLEAAQAGVLAGIFSASGQMCTAGSRVFLHAAIADGFLDGLVARAEAIRLGDPTVATTEMGPIASASHRAKIERMVQTAVGLGATALCGAKRPSAPDLQAGYFYEPTILTDVHNGDAICQEEVFGPVLTVQTFDDDDEVITRANDTRYGLAAGLWTRDLNRAHTLAGRLDAGIVWINTYRAEAFSSPFSGRKHSGFGSQNGIASIDGYLQTKSVWCDLSDEVQDPFVLKL